MKCSVITTVLNEIDSIQPFLDALLSQTREPEEIVIVDAGSTDGTIEYISTVSKAHPIIKLIVENGCNVARGRNIAIRSAEAEYIAMTDAGSFAETSWLDRLIEPFLQDASVDVVGGWVEYDPKTSFEEWLSLLNRPFEKIQRETYLPSARSLAMKKKCWEAVRGFPEDLSMWAEDTVFLRRLKEKGFHITMAREAVVHWRPRRTLKEFFVQYFEYGIGDAEAGLYPVLYIKRLGLVLSAVMLVPGIMLNIVVPVLCIVVLLMAFIRIVVPLKSPSVPAWKLFPLFLFILVKESAQLLGYSERKVRQLFKFR